MKYKILFGLLVIFLTACSSTNITSFEECVEAGNPVMESYPRQCTVDGQTFVEETCVDMCGDGICQEMVCMAVGCPCAETPENCPEDCK